MWITVQKRVSPHKPNKGNCCDQAKYNRFFTIYRLNLFSPKSIVKFLYFKKTTSSTIGKLAFVPIFQNSQFNSRFSNSILNI